MKTMQDEYGHFAWNAMIQNAGPAATAPAAVFDSDFAGADPGAIPSSHDIIRITRELVMSREGRKDAGAAVVESGTWAWKSIDEVIGWLRSEVEKNQKSAA